MKTPCGKELEGCPYKELGRCYEGLLRMRRFLQTVPDASLTSFARSHQSFLNIPAIYLSASKKCGVSYRGDFEPFTKIIRDAVDSYIPRYRRVNYLGLLVRPSTIFRGVVAKIINTVKSVLGGWLMLHIFYEVTKAILFVSPPLTDRDTLSTIPFVGTIRRLVATPNHSGIALVFSVPFKITSMLVFGVIFAREQPRLKAFIATLARIVFPPRGEALECISTITKDGHRATATERSIVRDYLESAVPIHKNIITRKVLAWV